MMLQENTVPTSEERLNRDDICVVPPSAVPTLSTESPEPNAPVEQRVVKEEAVAAEELAKNAEEETDASAPGDKDEWSSCMPWSTNAAEETDPHAPSVVASTPMRTKSTEETDPPAAVTEEAWSSWLSMTPRRRVAKATASPRLKVRKLNCYYAIIRPPSSLLIDPLLL